MRRASQDTHKTTPLCSLPLSLIPETRPKPIGLKEKGQTSSLFGALKKRIFSVGLLLTPHVNVACLLFVRRRRRRERERERGESWCCCLSFILSPLIARSSEQKAMCGGGKRRGIRPPKGGCITGRTNKTCTCSHFHKSVILRKTPPAAPAASQPRKCARGGDFEAGARSDRGRSHYYMRRPPVAQRRVHPSSLLLIHKPQTSRDSV